MTLRGLVTIWLTRIVWWLANRIGLPRICFEMGVEHGRKRERNDV